MKKNIYLIQPTFMNASSVHFPYAIGALASYAWSDKEIADAYNLEKIFFLRENIPAIVNSLKNPFLIGFSNYIWNFEYNKCLAKAIKKAFPDCIIVFGGPQIAQDLQLLDNHKYIDILILYEGEVAFKNLLKAFLYNKPLSDINNISYRKSDDSVIMNDLEVCKVDDFPSPYESGFFDRLCKENPDIDFIPLIETNRGCPNKCSYCSWGSIKSNVRLFPLERVFHDIEWVSSRKMEFLGFADANFGLFPRDQVIVDKIIECHTKNGYPKKFQVSYSKDTGDRVFEITKKLNENGMDKGVTLSFQSMSKTVQENIGRSNMDIEYYKKLLTKYSKANIPTYTDLILGLPGESFSSFKQGIDELLKQGQHTSLFVHLCEWLPLSEMGKADYIEKYKIGFTKIPLNQPHRSISFQEDIQEYSRIVTSTYSMTEDEWVETVLYSTSVLALHHLGLLQYIALFLYYEKGIMYSNFYSDILHYMLSETFNNDIFSVIKERAGKVISDNAAVVIFDDKFGNIAWPFEEYAFLKIVSEKKEFYDQIKEFLKKYIPEQSLLNDLIAYQKFVIKDINNESDSIVLNYDLKHYFDSVLYQNTIVPIKEEKVKYTFFDKNPTFSWPEYAKKVLWFGRRGGRNIYTSEIQKVNIKNEL